MLSNFADILKRLLRRERASSAIEFAVFLPLFLLLVGGLIDFGHALHLKQVLINASREGARYGARYKVDIYGNRILPQNLQPAIANYVINTAAENGGRDGWGLRNLLPNNANPIVVPGGPAYSETNPAVVAGAEMVVTITCRKSWYFLGNLIPGFGSSRELVATTGMLCE